MGQVLHGSPRTAHPVRAAIQRSQASIAELSRTYGVNHKTVAKWKKRKTVHDAPRSSICANDFRPRSGRERNRAFF